MTKSAKRTGPRPLGLYYAMLQNTVGWQQVLQGNPLFGQVFTQLADFFQFPPDGKTFLKGVERYRNYSWHRPKIEGNYTEVAQYGRARLYQCRKNNGGKPVLLIPSFVNKSYILDLLPGNSLVQHLHNAGFTPYLLDWGDPAGQPHGFTVETAITEAIVPALETFEEPPTVIGYCMGGILGLGAAAIASEKIKSLAVLATPWDFSVTQTHQGLMLSNIALEPIFAASPLIPVDVVQTLFVELDPQGAFNRMEAFANLEDEPTLQRMAALEDWLADGWPLEPNIAKTLIIDWHKNNQTHLGTWQIAGTYVKPENIKIPTLVAITEKDRLVPPESSAPLVEKLPNCTRLNVPMGHVGLMGGRKAEENFYQPLTKWLQSLT
ncbi:MAG: alpha/beta fold hydrolase [Alphaproteobacteria bacterium]|nr:alpha/beta fold hydrolase [Alphaproteobacteria bacterium]MDD9920339.1 alpha/beta fold hydrolase [Alphaproteobacteria bacterium]